MVIYLKHPDHGEKVACAEQEAVLDESKGWKRFIPDQAQPKAEPAPENKAPEEFPAIIGEKVFAPKRTYNRKA